MVGCEITGLAKGDGPLEGLDNKEMCETDYSFAMARTRSIIILPNKIIK
jgi:hypothetical protein